MAHHIAPQFRDRKPAEVGGMNRATEKYASFPTLGQAALIVLALFLFEYVALVALADMLGLRGDALNGVWGIATVLGYAGVFSLVLHHKQLSYRALFHASRNSASVTIMLLMLPIAMLIPALVLTMMSVDAVMVSAFPLSRSQEMMFQRMMTNDPMSVITVCILAPVLEEMLFRGIIVRSFLAQYPRKFAIFASAALFGAAHLNIYQFMVGLIAGSVLAWLYERSRSLWPCIALHCMYNSTISFFCQNFSDKSGNIAFFSDLPLSIWIGAFFLAFVGASVLQFMLRDRTLLS